MKWTFNFVVRQKGGLLFFDSARKAAKETPAV
jgi:hypothetical protein